MSTILFDIDTQNDFILPAGALPAPGANRIIPMVVSLNRWGGRQGVMVVSTMDAHAEDDPEFRVWPPHCVVGTAGQRKVEQTLLERRVTAPSQAADFDLEGVQQVILEKQALDCFTNANIGAVLRRAGAHRCIVYGVVTEYCVRLAALGLLKMGLIVEIVTDVVATLKREDGAAALREFAAAGGWLTTYDAVVEELQVIGATYYPMPD
jgi:nicotinamidase/pyrazinamidase